ncbi:MAG: AAA family ATPase, partial [Gammaproteobacteria bacterium]|nr:AAA family ATPase [Gammaproteobacteria bacterium]
MPACPRFMISAAHKSSGKTVVSTGLAAAFRAAGDDIRTFKKGPDYIDPMWLAAASGRPCYNLDFNTMTRQSIAPFLAARAGTGPGTLSLVEANKGLHDGVCADGSDSNAELAKLLGLPVVLVIDTLGMTRGIAPLLTGYTAFDHDVNIAGVILNRV